MGGSLLGNGLRYLELELLVLAGDLMLAGCCIDFVSEWVGSGLCLPTTAWQCLRSESFEQLALAAIGRGKPASCGDIYDQSCAVVESIQVCGQSLVMRAMLVGIAAERAEASREASGICRICLKVMFLR